MRTRRSPRNQARLWRELGEVKRPLPVKRSKLISKAEYRRRFFTLPLMKNPNCDNDKCTSATSEVRVLPSGGDSNLILCRACFNHEIRFREERNQKLADDCKIKPPHWESLKVYGEDVPSVTIQFNDLDDRRSFLNYVERAKASGGTVGGLYSGLLCSALKRATIVPCPTS